MPRIVKGSMNFKPAFKPKPKVNPGGPPKPKEAATSSTNAVLPARDGTERGQGGTTGTARRDLPDGDTIHVLPLAEERARMATPPASMADMTPPPTQTQKQTETETETGPTNDRSRQAATPPRGRVPTRFDPHLLPPTPDATQAVASSSRTEAAKPTTHPAPRSSPPISPSRTSRERSTPISPSQPKEQEPPQAARTQTEAPAAQAIPLPISIPANEYPHRMTDDELLPTPGFVLPSLKEAGGGPRAGPRNAKLRESRRGRGKNTASAAGQEEMGGLAEEEEEEEDSDGSDASEDAYEPENASGGRKKRAVNKRRNVRGKKATTDGDVSDEVQLVEGVEKDAGAGKKRKRTKKNQMPIDPTLNDLEAADGESGESGESDESEEQDGDGGKTKKGKNRRRAKRLRVNIRDDLDEETLSTLQPGQAIGDAVDEETTTMADLAAGPGQGRVSGKAIRLQQAREEIQRRKEEQEERRLKFRTQRETKMRGIGGEAAKKALEAEEGGDGEKEEGQEQRHDIEDHEDENEKDDDEGDDDLREVDENENMDFDAAEQEDDDDDDDQEFVVNQHSNNTLSYDENGQIVYRNVVSRQELLDESMNQGPVFQDNDDLKFTNSMSHSKRASTIRWTKDMKSKLTILLRQHGQVYETIAKIMALTYPIIERTHVANHMRAWNMKDPEGLTWALAKENKLDIDMSELKQVYPGIDFDAPLPDITMYFDPNIDPNEIRALKRKQSSKGMTEQDKKKQARKAALNKKKQEKMRKNAMMGIEEEGDEVGDEEIAAMRRQPGLPL